MDWKALLLVLYTLRTRLQVSGFPLFGFDHCSATFPICFSVVLLAVSRPQISALLGFSAPSRLPPPGFFSHERVGLSSDTAAGIYLFLLLLGS